MNLVRDVLDQQVIDCRQQKAGKVDGIALEIRPGEPPRVASIDMGIKVLARRISRRLESLAERWSEGVQMEWSKVEKIDVSVNLKVDITDYASYRVENWLREHVIEKIPGSAHQKHQEKHD